MKLRGTVLAAAVLVCAFGSAQAEIVGAPIDLSASVHEAIIPGGTIFDDANTVTGASAARRSAVLLLAATRGKMRATIHPRSPT